MSREARNLLRDIADQLDASAERITLLLSGSKDMVLSREHRSTIETARFALNRTRGHILYAMEQFDSSSDIPLTVTESYGRAGNTAVENFRAGPQTNDEITSQSLQVSGPR